MPSSRIQDLAQQLLAHEAAAGNSSEANTLALLRVSEKLRQIVGTLAGTTGFRMLLARALVLAKAQDPALVAVRVELDGSLKGLSEIEKKALETHVLLIAQLLDLLVSFIGEALVLHLIQDVWPDFSIFYTEPNMESEHDPSR
jgi:hypothetical protein